MDRDRDKDGLSDFHETHKYRTDPAKRDSDGDGIPDGDWRERREFTYSIRTVIQVMPAYDIATLNDDYQDARVLYECADYVELEIVHYPLNTVAGTIRGDRKWRRKRPELSRWLAPGPTTNWTAAMRKDLLRRLSNAGIDIKKLDDKQVVEKVSRWALEHARSLGKTCIWAVDFDKKGKPFIPEPLAEKFRNQKGDPSWSTAEQLQNEVMGDGMYENRTRGTCTTSANYLTTVLRAVGIPTRMIVTIPAVDGSNQRNVEMLGNRLTHHRIRRDVLRGVEQLGNSFAAHTYNEVWVGGRWHRLNYSRLGQNILDTGFMGLMTKVHTFGDLAHARLASGWGLGRKKPSDVFRHNNPYTALTISDLFGRHAKVANPKIEEHTVVEITKAYWFHDDRERPKGIGKNWGRAKERDVGHVLIHVDGARDGEGAPQYDRFWKKASRSFLLQARGLPAVRAESLQCWWIDPDNDVAEFYLRISKNELRKMKKGRTYRLVAENDGRRHQWRVAKGVKLRRPR